MAGIKFHPEDHAEMVQAVRDWVQSELPTGWIAVFGKAAPGAPQPPKPFARVNMLVPPVQDGQADRSPNLSPGCAVQVANVLDNTTYTITYNSTPAPFISDADATEAEIVAGLIAAVNGVVGATVATEVLGTVFFASPATIAVDANLRLKKIGSTEAEATATFSIDCIGRDDAEGAVVPGPIFESAAAAGGLRISLGSEDVLEALRAAGWSVISVEGERKPDEVAGSQWEDRSGFDLRLRCRTRRRAIVDYIEDVPIDSSIVGTLSP